MRHKNSINQLGRSTSHRKAMMANLANSLIEHKHINTTLAKARALRGFIEPLITKSKDDTTHSRRTVFAYLKNKQAVTELFREIAPKVANRPGGYTRIIKLGNRTGDAAEMAMIELVDFNEIYQPKTETKKTTRRSRRGGGKAAAPQAEAKTETPIVEDAVEVKEQNTEEPKKQEEEKKSE